MRPVHVALLLAALIAILGPVAVGADDEPTTEAVVERYLELTFSQQYDALLDVYAPDATFHDPTADVFDGPVAEGAVHGAEAIVAMQKSWGLAETTLARAGGFAVGEHALTHGVLTVGYAGSEKHFEIPFVNVLKVVEGRVAERVDFAEYVESFGLAETLAKTTAATRKVADPYLEAYLHGDLDTQAALLAPDVHFQDPTAAFLGADAPVVGAEALLGARKQMYELVESFELDIAERFYSNHHAVYIGTVRYAMAGEHYEQPGVAVIEVRNGKVTRQWDFVDYDVPPTAKP